MQKNEIPENVLVKAQEWLTGSYDAATRSEVQKLLDNEDPTELTDAFYRDLEFGTGGLRGIMGVGSNRMNIYTVGAATQGLCNYLKKAFPTLPVIKVAIGHDCRNNSRLFAETAANIFSANGIMVYLFESLRPTPELSFAIRDLGLQSGIILTASHNPKEYNRYKAYWDDGSQIVEPHDRNIITEVGKVRVSDIRFEGNKDLILPLGEEMDQRYLDKVVTVSLSPESIRNQHDLTIVYTPIHGTGLRLVPRALAQMGFTNIVHIPEQDVVSGDFPTVISPNPEEPAALALALQKAREVDADLVMATDPDADRVGIAVRDDQGRMILLNGNQTAALLFYYILNRWQEQGRITGKEFIVKTIVTSELLRDIAVSFGVEYFDVLTGFKYIADIILRNEGNKKFIVGGEESYGYLTGDFVRDKDAVSSCAMIAEAAAWMADRGRNLFDLLLEIYEKYAYYKESLLSVTKKGKSGAEEIQQMMVGYRTSPPLSINNSKVVEVIDYQLQKRRDLTDGKESDVMLPRSNVLQFILEDGSKISVRPSGTEPKIKFYFGVKEKMASRADYAKVNEILDARLNGIIASMNLR